jgi:hypothetical protein
MAPSSEVAIYLVPLVLLPMVMLGGALKPAPEMPQLARVVAHGVPSHWAFEGVLGAEAEARPPLPPPRAPSPRYDAAEGHFPEAGRSSPALVLWVLAGNVLLVTVAIGALLVLRDVRP